MAKSKEFDPAKVQAFLIKRKQALLAAKAALGSAEAESLKSSISIGGGLREAGKHIDNATEETEECALKVLREVPMIQQ